MLYSGLSPSTTLTKFEEISLTGGVTDLVGPAYHIATCFMHMQTEVGL